MYNEKSIELSTGHGGIKRLWASNILTICKLPVKKMALYEYVLPGLGKRVHTHEECIIAARRFQNVSKIQRALTTIISNNVPEKELYNLIEISKYDRRKTHTIER